MKRALTHGALWLGSGRLLVNAIGFVSTLVLARLLIPSDFGLVAIATTVAAIVGSITELSLSSALVQHPDPDDTHYDAAWTLGIARSFVLAAIVAGLSYPIALMYGDPRLVGVLCALALVSLLSGLINPKLVMFSRELVFRQDFALNVSQKLIGFALSLFIAYWFRSYWALVVGNAASQILGLVLSYVLRPYRPRFRATGGRALLSFSIWLSLGQAINTLNWKLDSLFIGYFLGAAPLGYYSVGDNLAQLPTREATAPIAQTLFPAFSRIGDDPARMRDAYLRATSLLTAIALPLGFGFAVLAKPIVLLALGLKWLPAVFVIQMLAGIFAVQTLASTLQPLAMAMGKTRLLFQRDLLNFAMRMPLIIGGLWIAGLAGMVVARVASGLISTVINMLLAKNLLKVSLREQLSVNARPALATIAMVGVLAAMAENVPYVHYPQGMAKAIYLALRVAVGAGIYGGVMMLLWTAAGRPRGIESEIGDAARSAILSIRSRQSGMSRNGAE